jgi:hypothetical protein
LFFVAAVDSLKLIKEEESSIEKAKKRNVFLLFFDYYCYEFFLFIFKLLFAIFLSQSRLVLPNDAKNFLFSKNMIVITYQE